MPDSACRPLLERLEDRRLLSAAIPTSAASDSADGPSLHYGHGWIMTGHATQPDGKRLTVSVSRKGALRISRFNANGSPDISFGHHGSTLVPLALHAFAHITVEQNGRIVVVVSNRVIRLLPSGVLDVHFGRKGKLKLPLAVAPHGFDPLPDGSFLLAGYAAGIKLAKFTPQWLPDPAFASGDRPLAMTVQGLVQGLDGSIYLSGIPAQTSGNSGKTLLAKYDALGHEIGAYLDWHDTNPTMLAVATDGSIQLQGLTYDGTWTTAVYTVDQNSFKPVPLGLRPIDADRQIEAENFDFGGSGAVNSLLNSASQNPSTAVLIGLDPSNHFHDYVDSTRAGDWMQYTILTKHPLNGISLFVSSNGPGGTFHAEIDGQDISGPITVPDTGGDAHWKMIGKPTSPIFPGQHALRLVMDENGPGRAVGNIDYFILTQGVDESFAGGALIGVSGRLLPQADGSILVFGQTLQRLLPDGTFDAVFGQRTLPFSPFTVVQDGDKFLLTRWSDGPTDLYRINLEGALDQTFGTNGQVQLPWLPSRIILDAQGKFVIGGKNGGVQRFLPDGQLDSSFVPAVAGKLDGVLPDGCVILLSDGGITGCDPLPEYSNHVTGCTAHGLLTRLNIDGSVDETYGENGTIELTADEEDRDIPQFFPVGTLPDGTAVVGVVTYNTDDYVGAARTDLVAIDNSGKPLGVSISIPNDMAVNTIFAQQIAVLGHDYPSSPYQTANPAIRWLNNWSTVPIRNPLIDERVFDYDNDFSMVFTPRGELLVTTFYGDTIVMFDGL
jgi:uncharacterized delta-60 repeat protein